MSNDPSQLLEPHTFHVHTNYLAIVAQGQWDYQKGIVTREKVKPYGKPGWGKEGWEDDLRGGLRWSLIPIRRAAMRLHAHTGPQDVFLVDVGRFVVFRMNLEDFAGDSLYVS